MIAAELSRARDRPRGDRPSRPQIDLGPLLGRWVIFAEETTGIAGVQIEREGGGVTLRAFGSGAEAARDWGVVPARVFADDVEGTEAWGFRATYEHGFERVELFGYLNRGLLAVEAGTTFSADDERSNYFTRTFMYRP